MLANLERAPSRWNDERKSFVRALRASQWRAIRLHSHPYNFEQVVRVCAASPSICFENRQVFFCSLHAPHGQVHLPYWLAGKIVDAYFLEIPRGELADDLERLENFFSLRALP